MFTKPLSQAEFTDVDAFCKAFGEGVRVEYKGEMIENIPKTISAFANTLGGIVIIGVETDKVQNRVTGINGIDRIAGIEEKILSSSLNGIYPSVIPEIQIFELPGKKDKILVVVKVHESVEVPHAVQNSTRVYIRTGSMNQPYELAEMDKIEYMLKRREKPEKLKEELRQRTRNRIERVLNPTKSSNPRVYVSISPVYPYKPLISLDDLYEFCNSLGMGYYIEYPERITDGVCKFYAGEDFSYREINHYGLVLAYEALEKIAPRWRSSDAQENERLYVVFAHIISHIGKALRLAERFYGKCGYLGSLEVKVEMERIAGEYLLYNAEGFPQHYKYQATDEGTSFLEITGVENIRTKLLDIVTSLARKILWVFNCPIEDPRVIIEKVLAAK